MLQQDLDLIQRASGPFNRALSLLEKYTTRTFPRVTYSGCQCDETAVLEKLLPGPGVYVDIGAAEPEQCSNTWNLYQRGWRGLLVEPLFWYWPALLHQRPGDYLYDVAVRDYAGITQLRVNGTVSSVIPGWSDEQTSNLVVPCETAASVLSRFPEIRDTCRFCSIDVEGIEKEVLSSIDWAAFRPDVFCVEYREYDPDKLGKDISAAWVDILKENQYVEVGRTPLNLIFQTAELSGK